MFKLSWINFVIAVAAALAMSICFVAKVQALSVYGSSCGDPVLLNADESLMIYPMFDDYSGWSYADAYSAIRDDLVWAGSSNWYVPTVDEVMLFFGSNFTYDNPDVFFDLHNLNLYYGLRTSTQGSPPEGGQQYSVWQYEYVMADTGVALGTGYDENIFNSTWAMAAVPAPIPEPSTLFLLLCGCFGVAGFSLKHKPN